ncbi:RepB family plasmid replication initiator protein [Escherichia coli]|uniref:RepB family plasmid replication initiator protein n=1 Tax=Escherichia coli TaxID=562 RepID=UPI002FF25E06
MNRAELTAKAVSLIESATPISRSLAQANEITEAAYHLTRDQKRLLFIVVGRLRYASKDGVLGSGACELTVNEYAEMYNLPSAEASKDIRKAISGLSEKKVTIYNPDESTESEASYESYPWMIKDAYSPRRGTYIIHLNPYLMPFFTLLDKRFTRLNFTEVSRLTNPYSMRLYESLCQYRKDDGSGFAILGVEWMRERYGLPKSYQRYAEFKRSFLTKAVAEIEKNTKMKIVFSEVTEGGKVTRIKFTYQQS